MKTRVALMIAAVGGLATIAAAQPQTQGSVTWNLQYFVVTPTGPAATPFSTATVAATPGGTVNEGQAALFRLSFDLSGTPGGFDPDNEIPLGSTITWAPSLLAGSSGTGGLGGLWGGNVNLAFDADLGGTWSDNTTAYSTQTRFRLTGGYVDGLPGEVTNGAITNISPAVFGANSHTLPHTDNVVVWTGLWIPGSYADRTENFSIGIGSLGQLSQVYAVDANGSTLPIALNVETIFGAGVGVPIVPAPSSLALLGLGGLVAARRRR